MSDIPTSPPPAAPETLVGRRPRLRRPLLLIAVPLLALLAGGVVYLKGGRYVDTDNAYVKADTVAVGAELAGTVKEVLVHDNQQVAAGQPLFRLDPAPFQVAVAKAEARLAQVRTDLAALKASYREKQAEIALARTKEAFALREQQRQAGLVAKKFISAAKFDDARQGSAIAVEQTAVAEQDLQRIAASLGGRFDAPIEQHPSYLEAQAALAQAQLDLAHVEVRAALPGTVSRPPKPGQYVAAGTTALALVVGGTDRIEANFPETDLTYVMPGQPVVIHIDTFPDATWHGVVDSLSPATGAEFALIPAQNATGNWVKIAQRVPVRIKLDATPGLPRLRAGLSAEVTIDTGHRRQLSGLSL
jgi:membrane fusion protein (multidrug efflux system)